MKQVLIAVVIGLIAGYGFLAAVCGLPNKEVAAPAGLHYNEDSGGFCSDGVCYPPWMTKEECEAEEAKRNNK